MSVVTRFAPSPTGRLHVGNIRTALHNWLLAKKAGVRFLLRIDDTDAERSREDYVDALRADLAWLGLEWDAEERQSARSAIYEESFQRLVSDGRIYRVAGLEGIELDELDHGFSVWISQDEINTFERCIYLHWRYRFEGERLVTQPIERPSCRRALNPDEAALMDALGGAQKVTRTPSNGILLEGPGGSVTLFSQ